MKLEIKDDSKNYACSVVKINEVLDIEGADKIKRVVVNGNSVVVSSSVSSGDIMLYFVSGTKLNKDFCYKNNLFEDPTSNYDTTQKGYINSKQRVKAVKLRGVVSDGMLMPLTSLLPFLEQSSIDNLKVGDEFTTINGNILCEKYFVPVIQSGSKDKQPKKLKTLDILLGDYFKFHTDTSHFAKNLHNFNKDSQVIITRKLHGSSLILSNTLVSRKLSLKEKILNMLGANIKPVEYGYVWSSGKPKSRLVKGIDSPSNKWENNNGDFYSKNIWERAYQMHKDKLEKGISIYAEIVGEGIQGSEYTYGFEYNIFVYRITYTSSDGRVVEFSWEQLKSYCDKYGLNCVQEYYVGSFGDLTLEDLKDKYLDKSYTDCKVDEGICIRLRGTEGIFKLKSPRFILKESDLQEKGVAEFES